MVKQNLTVDEMDVLLSRALVGRLGTCKDNEPYVVPLCFVYHKGKIYFHCGPKGKKMANMKANQNVCFQVDEHRLIPSSNPCNFTMHYKSVIVFGKVRFLEDAEEKLRILNLMIEKYDTQKIAKPLDKELDGVEIGEITIERISGKKNE